MLKIKLILKAKCNIPKTGLKQGDYCEIINDVFDPANGIAYYSIYKEWEIIKMEVLEYKQINKE